MKSKFFLCNKIWINNALLFALSNKNTFFQTVGGALWFIYMYCLYNFESLFLKKELFWT